MVHPSIPIKIYVAFWQVGRIQVIAFQALDGKQRQQTRIPVQVGPLHVVAGLESKSSKTPVANPLPKSNAMQPDIIDLDPVKSKASASTSKVMGYLCYWYFSFFRYIVVSGQLWRFDLYVQEPVKLCKGHISFVPWSNKDQHFMRKYYIFIPRADCHMHLVFVILSYLHSY